MTIDQKLFVEVESMNVFNTLKVSADSSDTMYRIGDRGNQIYGKPQILWEQIAYILEEHVFWTHGELFDDILSLASALSTLSGNVETLSGNIDSLSGQVTSLNSRVDNWELTHPSEDQEMALTVEGEMLIWGLVNKSK